MLLTMENSLISNDVAKIEIVFNEDDGETVNYITVNGTLLTLGTPGLELLYTAIENDGRRMLAKKRERFKMIYEFKKWDLLD